MFELKRQRQRGGAAARESEVTTAVATPVLSSKREPGKTAHEGGAGEITEHRGSKKAPVDAQLIKPMPSDAESRGHAVTAQKGGVMDETIRRIGSAFRLAQLFRRCSTFYSNVCARHCQAIGHPGKAVGVSS